MCGIAGGVWHEPTGAIDAATLAQMTDVLRHRGPDDEGFYLKSIAGDGTGPACGVALGHRRLSIIDLVGGHQPMSNEDETIWIVFNGEIYNFRLLRQELEAVGHRFRTRSDTEVLLHLYEERGLDFLKFVNGMFALALWDEPKRRLVLARDRLGEKPLVYYLDSQRLVFASELKALLKAPGIPRAVDPFAVDAYLLYQYIPHPWTIYRGIQKLPPATMAVYERGGLTLRRYWEPDFSHAETEMSREAIQEELRSRLEKAVTMRMEADVPLGAFLSGGIDSTIVVGLMQQFSSEPVRTFTIGFSVPDYDETRYARIAAEALGTRHEEFQVEPNALAVLPRLVWHFDEPMADSSALPTWYVAELTRRHVTVALTGDGGDELFLGYSRYPAAGLAGWVDRFPRWLRSVSRWGLWRCLPAGGRRGNPLRRLRRFMEAVSLPPDQRYVEWICIFNQARRLALYREEFLEQLPAERAETFLIEVFRRAASRDPITTAGLVDLITYLPCDLMVKVDIASMAHSLECRQPFLDHRVVELAVRMPLRLKYRWGRGKWILRRTFADLLPPAIQRRGKMGFGVPVAEWFRGPLRTWITELLTDGRLFGRGYFRPESIHRLLAEHMTGQFDHGNRLWALAILELWHRLWIDREEPSEPSSAVQSEC